MGEAQRGVATIVLPVSADTNTVVADLHARGIDASNDRILHICPSASACPATEPELAEGGPVPAVADWSTLPADRKVTVAVIDTDFHQKVAKQHAWLRNISGQPGGPRAEATIEATGPSSPGWSRPWPPMPTSTSIRRS